MGQAQEEQIRFKAQKIAETNRKLSSIIMRYFDEHINLAALTAKLDVSNERFEQMITCPREVPLRQLYLNTVGISESQLERAALSISKIPRVALEETGGRQPRGQTA